MRTLTQLIITAQRIANNYFTSASFAYDISHDLAHHIKNLPHPYEQILEPDKFHSFFTIFAILDYSLYQDGTELFSEAMHSTYKSMKRAYHHLCVTEFSKPENQRDFSSLLPPSGTINITLSHDPSIVTDSVPFLTTDRLMQLLKIFIWIKSENLENDFLRKFFLFSDLVKKARKKPQTVYSLEMREFIFATYDSLLETAVNAPSVSDLFINITTFPKKIKLVFDGTLKLSINVDPNIPGSEERTLLYYAASSSKNTRLTQSLFNAGASLWPGGRLIDGSRLEQLGVSLKKLSIALNTISANETIYNLLNSEFKEVETICHAMEKGEKTPLFDLCWFEDQFYVSSTNPRVIKKAIEEKNLFYFFLMRCILDDLDLPLDPLNSPFESIFPIKHLKFVGSGAYAAVFKVDTTDGKTYAIKLMMYDTLEYQKKSAQKEFDILSKLNHPNIIQCYNLINLGNTFGIQFDYISGGTLAKNIPKLTDHDKNKIACGVLKGVIYLHNECFIIHGDLKPRNILLDQNLNPIIIDMGNAATQTIEGRYELPCSGTAAYLSPQAIIAMSEYKTFTSDFYSLTFLDVYSLGITFWQMETATSPYLGIVNYHDGRPDYRELISIKNRPYPENTPQPMVTREPIRNLVERCWGGNTLFQQQQSPKEILSALNEGKCGFYNNLSEPMQLG